MIGSTDFSAGDEAGGGDDADYSGSGKRFAFLGRIFYKPENLMDETCTGWVAYTRRVNFFSERLF